MTQKLLLRATMLACAMLLGMTLQAQVKMLNASSYVEEICSPMAKPNPHLIFSTHSNSQPVGAQSKAAPAREAPIMATVTINAEFDSQQLRLMNGYFVECANHSVSTIIQSGEIPAGIYDIIFVFYSRKDRCLYYVVNEQCSVQGDFSLTVSPDQATHHVTTKCYGPDGELLNHPLGHYDEYGLVVIDEDSEIQISYVTNRIYIEGYPNEVFSFAVPFAGPQTEENRNCPCDFYINDVSDRVLLNQTKLCHTTDLSKSYCCYFSTTQVTTDQELVNNPNDYVSQEYTYRFTPYGAQQTGYGFFDEISFWDETWQRGASSGSGEFILGKPSGDYTHEVWMNVPYTDPNRPDLNVGVNTSFADHGEEYTVTVGEWEFQEIKLSGWTQGLDLRVKEGQKQFANRGHQTADSNENTISYFNDFYSILKNDFNEWPFSGSNLTPEVLTYSTDQALGIINDNCPINALYVRQYKYDNQLLLDMIDYYIGRYGETRWCDVGITRTAKFNGDEFDIENSGLPGLGEYEFTIVNPNVEVDGLPGHNTTMVYFDQNQEDMTPPAVEMLHFRSAEGVTDRFATAADGTIEFYAGDFNFQHMPVVWHGYLYEETGVFDCQPVEVTVEYAPYGTEDWNELAVEEIPEYYQEPGWGYFYRGSLAGVTGEGLNGWFDLRFRLKDESGNWMDQVVSPAFRIDDQAYSSVATVGSDNAREVARYNLAGQRVDDTHHGVTIVRMSDGTARKVIQ